MSHLLTVGELSPSEINALLKEARSIKKAPAKYQKRLQGKTIAMIFAKPSTRTLVSFEVGIYQLGGFPIYLQTSSTQLGRGESIADTSRVLNRYVNGIVARLYAHTEIEELAQHSTIPVINALTDSFHPCQALSDLLTLQEKFGKLKGLTLSYVGDADNNVCHSLLLACSRVGINVTVVCPPSLPPQEPVLQLARQFAESMGATIEVQHDPAAVQGSDVLYTDVWISMGQETRPGINRRKAQLLKPYQVNPALLRKAGKEVRVMHCLPAHRGQEITDSVMDSPAAIVFDQAENRLHMQKAILSTLFKNT